MNMKDNKIHFKMEANFRRLRIVIQNKELRKELFCSSASPAAIVILNTARNSRFHEK